MGMDAGIIVAAISAIPATIAGGAAWKASKQNLSEIQEGNAEVKSPNGTTTGKAVEFIKQEILRQGARQDQFADRLDRLAVRLDNMMPTSPHERIGE